MVNRDSKDAGLWFEKAEKNLKRAKLLLKDGDVEMVLFCLQQCLELSIKGCIVSQPGHELIKRHELDFLFKELLKRFPELSAVSEKYEEFLEDISPYYIEVRYPMSGVALPSLPETKRYLEKAEKLMAILESAVYGKDRK